MSDRPNIGTDQSRVDLDRRTQDRLRNLEKRGVAIGDYELVQLAGNLVAVCRPTGHATVIATRS